MFYIAMHCHGRQLLVVPPLLIVLTGFVAACTWQRIPSLPPSPVGSTIPLRVGVEISTSPGSQFYGPKVVGILSEAQLFSELVYPMRPEDVLDGVLSLSIDGAWRPRTAASFWSGVGIGLTFGALSPVIGPSMNGVHDLSMRLSSEGKNLASYDTRIITRVTWGILGNSGEVGAKADDLRTRKIVSAIAGHLRGTHILIEKARGTTSTDSNPEPPSGVERRLSSAGTLADEVRKLDELRRSGALTEEEFQQAKKMLLLEQ